MLPTFIHIGPGRSATTMFHEAFKEHPDICMSKIKETNYFYNQYHRGVGWYKAFFEHCSSAAAMGEISNNYFFELEIPARIAELLPDVKIITVLRNPFERIQSVFTYRQKRAGTIDRKISLEEAIKRYPKLVTDNYYGDHIKRYLEHFPDRNVLIAFYDDLEQNPEKFMHSIFRFIGVDDAFVPESVYKHINPSVSARHSFLTSMAYLTADKLRQWQLHSLLNWAKGSPVVRGLLFKSKKEMSMRQAGSSEQLNDILLRHFLPQIKEVEEITGRKLTEWYSD
jgi:hypothetical protein